MNKIYFPSSERDVKEMLAVVGLNSVEELFDSIPEGLKMKGPLKLAPPKDEIGLLSRFEALAAKNGTEIIPFMGGGSYPHHVPAIVDSISSRGEFLTPYTPYQPELSQGTLQIMFEYQTLMARLTGMEISNASLYDGATACAEAVLMALRINKQRRVIISSTLHPIWRQVLKTYLRNLSIELVELPFDESGRTDLKGIEKAMDEKAASIIIQSPNFFGVVEDLPAISAEAKKCGTLLLAGVAEPLSMAFLKPPGQLGADIVFGEAASFGLYPAWGGPYLGFIASKKEYVRELPGRITGETTDSNGKRGFVLTLSTREQHIRREKATSNICTNQAWCAVRAAIYLETMGRKGLMKLARLNHLRAAYARERLSEIKGVKIRFSGHIFNEFAVEFDLHSDDINRELIKQGLMAGLPIAGYYPGMKSVSLLCFTELHTKESIDRLVDGIGRIAGGKI